MHKTRLRMARADRRGDVIRRLFLGLGRVEEAMADFSRSLEAQPMNPTAIKWRAACLEKQKRFDDAIR